MQRSHTPNPKGKGGFKKGRSGNPSGRPKKTPELLEVETLCKHLSPMAVERLGYWMQQDDARASIAASAHILDRAFGKPKQAVENTGVPLIDNRTIYVNASQLEPDQREMLRLTLQQSRDEEAA